MPDDTERLVVALEARIRDFERNMQRAERTGTRSYRELSAGSTRATREMERDMVRSSRRINEALATTSARIGAFGKAFAGGLVAGVAIGALEGIRQAAIDSTKSILETADAAKRAGVSFKAFQELKFVAEQNRIEVDALTDGMKELSLRTSEFVLTGGGGAADAFKRMGYDAETLKEKLKAPDQLFLDIIGKLSRIDRATAILQADELFGGAGEQFVQLLDKGEASLRAQIRTANELGIVMDEQMVAKAEKVNQKFNLIATTVGTHLKAAIVNAVSAWTDFLDSYNAFDKQRGGTLEKRQSDLGMKRLDLENERSQIKAGEGGWLYGNPDGPLAKGRIHEIELELARLADEERRIVEEINKRVNAVPPLSPSTSPVAPGSSGGSSDKGAKAGLTTFLAPGKDASHISGMSSGFESKLEQLLQNLPKELAGQITINSGFRSIERQQQLWQQALEKYGSVAEARKWVAPPGNSQHNKGNAADLGYGSDAARQWAHDNAGKYGLSFPLSNENWHIEDGDARAGAMADRTKDLEARGQAYDDMLAKARAFIAEQGLEGDALSMTEQAAARLRYEQQLLNEAKQAGLDLSPAQIENMKALAAEMANAEAATKSLATSQEDLRKRAQEFGAAAGGVARGFVQDMVESVSAADALKNALGRVADQLLDGALNQLFGGGGVQGGGLFGSVVSGLFSGPIGLPKFAKGGIATSPSIFGEAGAEAAVPLPDGRRIPVDLGSGAASKTTVDVKIGVAVDDQGALQAYVKRQTQTTLQAAAPAIVAESVSRANRSAPSAVSQWSHEKAGRDYRNG